MRPLSRVARTWIVGAAIIVLIAVHAIVLGTLSSHVALSATAIGAVVVLLVAKHLGLLASLVGLIRGRSRKAP